MMTAGGAFAAGDPLMYCPAFKYWMRQLAAQGIAMRVLSVGYPLAPENPYPAAVVAAAAAYRWLLKQLEAEGSQEAVILGECFWAAQAGSAECWRPHTTAATAAPAHYSSCIAMGSHKHEARAFV
jgi:hypothetical protein